MLALRLCSHAWTAPGQSIREVFTGKIHQWSKSEQTALILHCFRLVSALIQIGLGNMFTRFSAIVVLIVLSRERFCCKIRLTTLLLKQHKPLLCVSLKASIYSISGLGCIKSICFIIVCNVLLVWIIYELFALLHHLVKCICGSLNLNKDHEWTTQLQQSVYVLVHWRWPWSCYCGLMGQKHIWTYRNDGW